MARGDAIFARCNVDWPDDPRCVELPGNDTRWLNHLLWLWATKARSPVIPNRYTLRYMARMCGVGEGIIQDCLRAMAGLDLIAVAPDGRLVVEGVTNQNTRLGWKDHDPSVPNEPYPAHRDNLWVKDPKYLWGNGVPVTILTGPKEIEKEIENREGDGQERPIGAATRPPDEELRDPKNGKPYVMPLKAKGASCTIPRSKGIEWDHTYGDSFNVPVELRKCIQYYLDNPAKRKTDVQNAVRAIGNWLRKTQNDGSGQPPLSRAEKRAQRERLQRAREADEAQAARVSQNIAAKDRTSGEPEQIDVGSLL